MINHFKNTNYSQMKRLLLFFVIVAAFSSCSNISGKYSQFNEGWLGTQNSLSTYDFGSFGSVTYMNSTSGSRSSNSYYSSKGKYNIEGNKVVLNFGGSLSSSNKCSTLIDIYKNYINKEIPMLENILSFYRKSNGKTKNNILSNDLHQLKTELILLVSFFVFISFGISQNIIIITNC